MPSVACRVEEALACLAAGRLDAVIADYLLPEGPTLPVLREADRLGVPVVVMTGHPAVIELLDGGKWVLLRKPFGMAELQFALESPLGTPAPVRVASLWQRTAFWGRRPGRRRGADAPCPQHPGMLAGRGVDAAPSGRLHARRTGPSEPGGGTTSSRRACGPAR